MATRRRATNPLLLAALVAFAAGCERVLDLRVALVTQGCDELAAGLSPMAGVQLLRFSVYGDGLRAADYEITASPSDGKVELPQVPAGKNRILVVEGLTAQGSRIVSLGTTGPLDLTVSASSLDVTVFLRRTDAFSIACPADAAVPGGGSLMNAARANHAVTELEDGRVLITGGLSIDGNSISYLNTTELYDPKTGRFVNGPSLALPRAHHTATHIPGTPYTIVVGGRNSEPALQLAELFDESIPPNGAFVKNLQMVNARRNHVAAAPDDGSGRVVIAGGLSAGGAVTGSVEYFDVRLESFQAAGVMENGARAHAAAVAIGANVYVVGGFDGTQALKNTFVLSPRPAGTFQISPLPALSLSVGRMFPLAAPIGNLLVVAAGASGVDEVDPERPFKNALASVDSLDTAAGSVVPPGGNPPTTRRVFGAAVPLKNDTVLLAGGGSATANVLTTHKVAEVLYLDVNTGRLNANVVNSSMRYARERLRMTALRDGTVLVTGGVSESGATLNTAELFQPTYVPTPTSPWK